MAAKSNKKIIAPINPKINSATNSNMQNINNNVPKHSISDNYNTSLIQLAKKEFGTTTNINEAGYIIQSGEMLDFSEKKRKLTFKR